MNLKTRQLFTTPLFAAIGRLSGVLIPFIIAIYYGVSQTTDSFFFAFTITFFIFGVFQQVFESVLLPYLMDKKDQGFKHVEKIARTVLVRISAVLGLVIFIFYYFLPPILNATTGFEPSGIIETQRLFLALLPFLFLAIIVSSLNGLLNTYKHFALPAFSPFLRSVGVIAIIVLGYRQWGIYAIPFGFLVGEFVRVLVTLRYIRQMAPQEKHAEKDSIFIVRSFWSQSGLQILALMCVQFIPLLNQWFATWLQVGDISVLGYAERLYLIPFQIFLAGLSQVYLSDWSEQYKKLSSKEFRKEVYQDSLKVLCFSAVISVILYVLKVWIIRFTYGMSSGIDESMIFKISEIFGWLVIGFAPAVLTSLLLRVFFVMKKTGLFLAHSALRLIVQITLNIVLIGLFGLKGIAIALTLTSVAGAFGAVIILERLWKVKSV